MALDRPPPALPPIVLRAVPGADHVLTPEALAFIADLQGRFGLRLHALDEYRRGGGMPEGAEANTEDALVVAVTECLDCGHLDTFNYFSILKKVRAQQATEQDNGNNSSI